jgi:translation initiation factor IF-2
VDFEALADLIAPGTARPKRGGRGTAAPATGEEGGKEGPVTLGGREQRQLKRKKTGTAKRRTGDEEEDGHTARRPTHIKRTGAKTAAPRKGRVVVQLPCTVRSFCEAVGVPARTVLAKMLELGVMTNIAASLDPEMAEMLAVELGLEVDLHKQVAIEDTVLQVVDGAEEDPATMSPRPPVITFLGHVDHGKTSLLDRILSLKVAAGEKGGITQHIRAYQIEKDGRKIAFVDTPGHEAFTEMRARGANVTDIAVLVVAADDGVMPQTEEAISHARAANVPIVVALNKIDLPGANPDRVYQQLAAAELLPTEWGGDTEVVKTSATIGTGVDQLLETLLTVAELHDYRANADRAALGTCLEASLHEGRGVVAKMLVQKGTLRVGDIVVCGPAFGRVKAMFDPLNERRKLQEAGPSTPAQVTGLSCPPGAGDRFYVLDDISQARAVAESRQSKVRESELAGARAHVTLENLFERLGQQDTVQTLNIVVRADVRGSIEAIRKELGKLQHPEVQIKVLQATVGGITEADVHLADASDAIIVGFNVVPDEAARLLADRRGVQVRRYDIIYQLTDDLKAALQGMLRPEMLERDLGRALVQQCFHISRVGTVAGCRVLAGSIVRDARIRVIRDSRVIGDYALDSLKREKDDAREVREGMECGLKLAGFNDVKEGDVLEAYKIEEIARTL